MGRRGKKRGRCAKSARPEEQFLRPDHPAHGWRRIHMPGCSSIDGRAVRRQGGRTDPRALYVFTWKRSKRISSAADPVRGQLDAGAIRVSQKNEVQGSAVCPARVVDPRFRRSLFFTPPPHRVAERPPGKLTRVAKPAFVRNELSMPRETISPSAVEVQERRRARCAWENKRYKQAYDWMTHYREPLPPPAAREAGPPAAYLVFCFFFFGFSSSDMASPLAKLALSSSSESEEAEPPSDSESAWKSSSTEHTQSDRSGRRLGSSATTAKRTDLPNPRLRLRASRPPQAWPSACLRPRCPRRRSSRRRRCSSRRRPAPAPRQPRAPPSRS